MYFAVYSRVLNIFWVSDHCNPLSVRVQVEFHGLRQMHRHQEFATVVEKLLQAFVVVHTHGNTCCGNFNFKGFTVPNTFEAPAERGHSPAAEREQDRGARRVRSLANQLAV